MDEPIAFEGAVGRVDALEPAKPNACLIPRAYFAERPGESNSEGRVVGLKLYQFPKVEHRQVLILLTVGGQRLGLVPILNTFLRKAAVIAREVSNAKERIPASR